VNRVIADGGEKEVSMSKADRGFASMDRIKQREIASKGGKVAHEKGTAHEWTSEEARRAGRRGGMAGSRRRAETEDVTPPNPMGLASTELTERSSRGDDEGSVM
jgi:uncharacterized protein